ncbi:YbaB/EbfC family nucleoid-associated protein [Nocardia sp. NPDC052112]|uniref:YbaB/EbfC family nucleoid-associated protein n=1 Tax=Nocardia sp. NPDC052112 TaxID=3155646 RepID=UPI00344A3047
MERSHQEDLHSAGYGLRNQVDHLLDAYEQQQTRLDEVQRQLETLRVPVSSPDRMVEVVVDAQGVLADVALTAAALRRPLDELGRSITETAQAAAQSARQQVQTLLATVTSEFDGATALSDIVEHATDVGDIRTRTEAGDSADDGSVDT